MPEPSQGQDSEIPRDAIEAGAERIDDLLTMLGIDADERPEEAVSDQRTVKEVIATAAIRGAIPFLSGSLPPEVSEEAVEQASGVFAHHESACVLEFAKDAMADALRAAYAVDGSRPSASGLEEEKRAKAHEATIEYLILAAEDWAKAPAHVTDIRTYLEYSLGTTACAYFIDAVVNGRAELASREGG